MRRIHAIRPSTIILVVLALLASRAGLAVRSPSEARVLLAATLAPGGSTVGYGHGLTSDSEGATRIAFVRPAPPSITRSNAPISGGNGDARGTVALGAPLLSLARGAIGAPATVEVRREGMSSQARPATAARAPPIG